MNKILKNILLTVIIIFIFMYNLIAMFFATYGVEAVILNFPETCEPNFPWYCVGTPYYHTFEDILGFFSFTPILLFIISIIYLLKIWWTTIDTCIKKIFIFLFTTSNRRCDDCKKAFKKEELKLISYHESHWMPDGVENPTGGLHTLVLCKKCYEEHEITTEGNAITFYSS